MSFLKGTVADGSRRAWRPGPGIPRPTRTAEPVISANAIEPPAHYPSTYSADPVDARRLDRPDFTQRTPHPDPLTTTKRKLEKPAAPAVYITSRTNANGTRLSHWSSTSPLNASSSLTAPLPRASATFSDSWL